MNEYEMIEKIIEPFSFADGKIYFYGQYEKQIECNMLWVAASSTRVDIYDNGNYYARHEVYLSTLGCDNVDTLRFSKAILRAMQRKFGVWNIVCSDIACTDEYLNLYQFCIKRDTDQNIKNRKECEKKAIELNEEIQETQKRLVEKQRELDPISKQYKSLVRSRNSLPFYALKQKKI